MYNNTEGKKKKIVVGGAVGVVGDGAKSRTNYDAM